MGIRSLIIMALACVTFGSTSQAATLVTSGGMLTGAKGVDVNGTFYDVQFLDGTCNALFSGCDSAVDFVFSTFEEAGAAANALLSQVFLGSYDTHPELTNGCIDISTCLTLIPQAAGLLPTGVAGRFTVRVAKVFNHGAGSSDAAFAPNFFGSADFSSTNDTSFFPDTNYAVFSLSAPTPLPGALPLMLSALGMGGVFLRRKVAA